jgi:hypothetical protein
MTRDESPYSRFRRAIRSGYLALTHATAAELPYVPMADALAILLVLDAEHEGRFEPAAAVRWAGRLAIEAPGLDLAELAGRSSRCTRCLTRTPKPRCWRWPAGAPAPRQGRRSQQPGPRWWSKSPLSGVASADGAGAARCVSNQAAATVRRPTSMLRQAARETRWCC